MLHKHAASMLCACGAMACIGGALAAQRVEVPIEQITLPNGDLRYYVSVTIGGAAPIKAMLDTGSTGLRVLESAIKTGQYRATGTRTEYRFTNGARFEGSLVEATIGLGALATERPIAIHVIDHVACVAQRPNCPPSRVAFKDFRIAGGGGAGQGFDAIIGTSLRRPMRQPNAENPLSAMGDDSWIVVLPLPGSDQPGHLIINPAADDRAGFTTVKLRAQPDNPGDGEADNPKDPEAGEDPGAAGSAESDHTNGKRGWRDAALDGCIVDDAAKTRLCGKTLIDSGAIGFSVDEKDRAGSEQWSAGTHATFEIAGADKPIAFSFVTGKNASAKVSVHPPRHPNLLRISAGSEPYFFYSVLYDAKAGSMGFKLREPRSP